MSRPAKKTVIFLCQDTRLCAIYKRFCDRHDITLKIVRTGEKALSSLKEKKCAALLIDRASIKEDAFLLIEDMRRYEQTKRIPVIMLSHVSDHHDIERSRALKVHAFIISAHSHPIHVVEKLVNDFE